MRNSSHCCLDAATHLSSICKHCWHCWCVRTFTAWDFLMWHQQQNSITLSTTAHPSGSHLFICCHFLHKSSTQSAVLPAHSVLRCFEAIFVMQSITCIFSVAWYQWMHLKMLLSHVLHLDKWKFLHLSGSYYANMCQLRLIHIAYAYTLLKTTIL